MSAEARSWASGIQLSKGWTRHRPLSLVVYLFGTSVNNYPDLVFLIGIRPAEVWSDAQPPENINNLESEAVQNGHCR